MINILEKPTLFPICEYLWSTDEDLVKARVLLSHKDSILNVSYKVESRELRRMVTLNNGPVYEDSCCEIFLMNKGDEIYYNFEFSASGAALIGRGESRHNRMRFGNEIIDRVERKVEVLENTNKRAVWQLDVKLDLALFDLDPSSLRGNIYLCGDKLKKPVYLALAPVDTISPDYHRKEFFIDFNLC